MIAVAIYLLNVVAVVTTIDAVMSNEMASLRDYCCSHHHSNHSNDITQRKSPSTSRQTVSYCCFKIIVILLLLIISFKNINLA